jgi:hypothetical protein
LDPQLADTDGDGISDAIEVGGDLANPTDTDGDGVIDALEFAPADPTVLAFVVPAPAARALSVPDLSGARVTLSGNGAVITANNNGMTGLPLYAQASLAVADPGYSYPFGLYDFSVTANRGTAAVTLVLPADSVIPATGVVRKLGVGDLWRTLDSGLAVIDRDNVTITLLLTDDDQVHDLDDRAGIIRDPVGLAVPVAVSVAAPGDAAGGDGGGGGCSYGPAPRRAGIGVTLPLLLVVSLLYLLHAGRRNNP